MKSRKCDDKKEYDAMADGNTGIRAFGELSMLSQRLGGYTNKNIINYGSVGFIIFPISSGIIIAPISYSMVKKMRYKLIIRKGRTP
jgi:hypothetical protein